MTRSMNEWLTWVTHPIPLSLTSIHLRLSGSPRAIAFHGRLPYRFQLQVEFGTEIKERRDHPALCGCVPHCVIYCLLCYTIIAEL